MAHLLFTNNPAAVIILLLLYMCSWAGWLYLACLQHTEQYTIYAHARVLQPDTLKAPHLLIKVLASSAGRGAASSALQSLPSSASLWSPRGRPNESAVGDPHAGPG